MASSVIPNRFIVKDYSFTTEENAHVSPFGAYKEVYAPIPTGYKVISVEVLGGGSTNPTVVRHSNGQAALVYSRNAATFTLRVTFIKS